MIKSIWFLILSITMLFLSFTFNKNAWNNINLTKQHVKNTIVTDTNGAEFGDWIIIHQMSEPEKLNPIVSNDLSASDINMYLFEPLIDIDRASYEFKPILAKSRPEISNDHLNYTFDLKENITFSDGKKLTGEDVIFTFKSIFNPFTKADALRNYLSGFVKAVLVNGNKYKVKITVSEPYFKNEYNLGSIQILPRHILDPKNINNKFSWKDFQEAQGNLDNVKFSEMYKFAEFINSEIVSKDAKYLIGSGP